MRKMEPIHRLALQVIGWGLLAVLSFFFHVVAFVVVLVCMASRLAMFKFVYENTQGDLQRENQYDADATISFEQLSIPGIDSGTESVFTERSGSELGSVREGRLRKNLPESEV